jgi:type I restriction enzyme R subunit
MTFNESNTAEAHLRDLLCGPASARATQLSPGFARLGGRVAGLGWHFIGPADLSRQPQEVLVGSQLSDALIRLNPAMAASPSRVEDVLYRLRAIIMSARSDGLVKTNEEFAAWLLGERSMPFGQNGEHVTICPSISIGSKIIPLSSRGSSPFAPARQKNAPTWSCWSMVFRLL